MLRYIKNLWCLLGMMFCLAPSYGQERIVNVDFESSSFTNSPTIPFDQPFIIQGKIYREVEFVEVLIFNENASRSAFDYTWNRDKRNESEIFEIVVPGILVSNSKYDFQVKTYTEMSPIQKELLRDNLRERIVYYLRNNITYSGNRVEVSQPKHVHRDICELVGDALEYYRSKNAIDQPVISNLLVEELERHADFKFRNFLRKKQINEQDSIANEMITERVNSLANLVMSEVEPYINSDLVQLHRMVDIQSVGTDKDIFTLPVNAGMYAWSKSVDINNTSVNNIDFTPGLGITLPFSNRSSLFSRARLFDSFGYSMGVLIEPVTDANGNEYITPGIGLPVYAGLGLRIFKVVRFNVGALVLAEQGIQDFSGLSVLPTAGLSLELNVWMGIKK